MNFKMMTFRPFSFSLISILLAMTVTPMGVRAESPASAQPDSAKSKDGEEESKMLEHFRKGYFIISPRYFLLAHQGHHGAFENNGFAKPSSGLLNFEFSFGKRTDSGFLLGLAIGQGGQGTQVGAYTANYQYLYGGFHLAYDFLPESDWDFTLGSVFGYGGSSVEVFSTAQNGRVTEGAAIFEPSVAFGRKITDRFKLGAIATYMVPFGASRSVIGTDLGSRDFSPRGFNVGVQFIFGRFGE